MCGGGRRRRPPESRGGHGRHQAQTGVVEDTSVRSGSVRPHAGPQELVLSIHYAQKDDGAEAFVIVVQGATLLGLHYGHMFAVYGPTRMMIVPATAELVGHCAPLVWGAWQGEHLFPVFFIDGCAHLWDE